MNDRQDYVIISPCRNEAEFMRRTLDSVTSQTIQPVEWIVVDDGSTDGTSEILQEYAERFSYMTVIRRQDRGRRSVGPGVVDAFYEGYDHISVDYDYLCKLDMDLDLPPRHFERLIEIMKDEPRLGTVSGKAFYTLPTSSKKVFEQIGDHVSLGMTKFYRRQCFEQIGGFVREVMWDGIDCHRARMFGWIARSFNEPDLQFEHLRPMGSSDRNILVGRKRHGYGQYFMGSSLSFMTASALSRLNSQPRFVGALMMWWGYTEAMMARRPRYDDPAFIRFVRRWQWLALWKGVARATAQVSAEQQRFWLPHGPSPCPSHHLARRGDRVDASRVTQQS